MGRVYKRGRGGASATMGRAFAARQSGAETGVSGEAMGKRMDDRVTGLEERIAGLERMIDDLSDVVARQDKEIETLTARVAFLLEREAGREAEGGGGVILGDERPPHY